MSTCPELRSVDDVTNDSQDTPHRSRTVTAQNESVLLKALGVTGLTPIANAIGHDHTYVSRWRSGTQGMNMRDVLTTLEKCGLTLVRADPNMVSVDKERYAALVTMANLGQRQINEEMREIMGRSE